MEFKNTRGLGQKGDKLGDVIARRRRHVERDVVTRIDSDVGTQSVQIWFRRRKPTSLVNET
jgi:hypothetical protein